MGHEEGETTVACSLALSMALAGDRVILVDADLRNPTVHRYLGLPNTQGLAEVLADADAGWSEKIQAVDLSPFVDAALLPPASTDKDGPPVAKFMCLTSGSMPDDIVETLRSPALSLLLADLKGYSDYVIVSGPPMADVSEALALAQHVDSTILTTSLGKDTAAETNRVRGLLNTAGVNAMGLVVMGLKPRNAEAYDVRLAAGEPDDELGAPVTPL
jgi:Mrp family chromosome partitioning ATPase